MQGLCSITRAAQAAWVVAALVAGPVHAAFIDRGNGVVYDSASGLDWELRPGTAVTNWHDARSYVAGLTLDGGGWRLPTINEGKDLYAHIRALTGCTDCTGDQDLFQDIQLAYWTMQTYWAGQDGAYYVGMWRPNYHAGLFQTTVGASTWAVRVGAPVPEPASLTLAAGALGVLALMRRRVRRRGL